MPRHVWFTGDMLLTEIDHIAIAVRDLDAAIDYYQRAFGAEVHHREIVESDGVEEALIKVGRQLHPADRGDPAGLADRPSPSRSAARACTTSAIAVDDCAAALAAMVAAGATAIDAQPRPGQSRHDGRLRPPKGQLRHA